jgi:hypothetical protein
MSDQRHDDVVSRLRVALREEADLAMTQADVGSAFVDFGARLHRDRRRRATRAIAACLALLAALAAVGIMRENTHRQPVIEPPTPDRGGPRLNDPRALPIEPGQEFTGHGRRYFSPGFGPEFSFIEPAARWSVGGPISGHGGEANAIAQPHQGALYLVRGDSTRSTQLLTFLIWRNVLDDNVQPSPAPPDIAAWLAANPHLADVQQQSDTVAGLAAVRVDATVASIPARPIPPPEPYCQRPVRECLLLADNADQTNRVTDGLYLGRPGAKPAYIELGARVRFWIIPLPNGERLVINAAAQPAQFDPFIAEVDQIVKSLVIAG